MRSTLNVRRVAPRWWALGLAVVATLAVGGVALAADNQEVYVPALDASIPADKAKQVNDMLREPGKESAEPAPSLEQGPDSIPATLLDKDAPVPVSPAIITANSAWVVSDAKTLVAVYAGLAGDGKDSGRFVVIRQDWIKGQQTQDVIDVPGARPPLTSVSPPEGSEVEVSAPTADLQFSDHSGATGVLHLADAP
jgi:hypothetical protein